MCVRQFGPQYGGLDVWGQLRLADPISDAIDVAKVMVMLVIENANESAQMARELVRGASQVRQRHYPCLVSRQVAGRRRRLHRRGAVGRYGQGDDQKHIGARAGGQKLSRAGLLVINPPYGFEAAIQAGAALIAPPLETAIRAG